MAGIRWWPESEAINTIQDEITITTVLPIAILLAILSILWYKYFTKLPTASAPPLPPGPRGLPIVGYLPFLGSDLHNEFNRMADSYGPIFKFYLGSKLHVVVNSPELIKVVVRDHDEIFANRNLTVAAAAITYGGRDLIFSENNATWRNLRKIFVQEILSNKNLKESSFFRMDEVRKTIKNLFRKVGDKVNISEIAFLTEANVIRRMVWDDMSFGAKKDSQDLEAEKGFQDLEIKKGIQDLGAEKGSQDLRAEKGSQDLEIKTGIQDLGAEKGSQDLGVKKGIQDLGAQKGSQDLEVKRGIQDFEAEKGSQNLGVKRSIQDLGAEKGSQDLGGELRIVAENITKILGQPNLSDFFPILSWFDPQGVERNMRKQHKKLDEIFAKIIEDRIECNSRGGVVHEGKKDFLQILLDLKNEEQQDGKSLNITQVKALLSDFMIAGTETTTALIEWAMTNIMRNHNVMQRVQQELEEIVGLNNMVEESHLPKLQYLDATIKETFRLHPIAPILLPRVPSKDCVVGGYTIPKGSIIFLNAISIHRNPQYWDNPMDFNPERFLAKDTETKWDYSGNNFKFLPFGSGRRLCPGVPLAQKMQMFILASLLHSFDWNLPEGEEHDVSENFGLALKKRKPLVAVPSQRLHNAALYM